MSAGLKIAQDRDRLEGVRRAVQDHGLPPSALQVLVIGTVGNMKDGGVAAARIVGEAIPGTGIICGNDLIAHLGRVGATIPGDYSVIGYDDSELAEQNPLPLTTIRQPKHNMGRTAAQLLIEEAEETETHSHKQIVFQPELIVRETTAQLVRQTTSLGQRDTRRSNA